MATAIDRVQTMDSDMLILGRGGYAPLSKYADILNVRLQLRSQSEWNE